MSYVHLITPYDYYYFELYKLPRNLWFQFIFDHEIPSWNYVLSPNLTSSSKKLLSSKYFFHQESKKHGIPSIHTKEFIKNDFVSSDFDLFTKESLFFKPNSANRSEGCYILNYIENSEDYILEQELEGLQISGKQEISRFLNPILNSRDYIIQSFLVDHPELSEFRTGPRLTTLRLITVVRVNQVDLISAILEVSIHSKPKSYRIVAVNPVDGIIGSRLIGSHLYDPDQDALDWIETVSGLVIPCWEQILAAVVCAHNLCLDIKTVGWDVAITTKGVKIIEGNFGWGVRRHQWGLAENIENFSNPIIEAIQ